MVWLVARLHQSRALPVSSLRRTLARTSRVETPLATRELKNALRRPGLRSGFSAIHAQSVHRISKITPMPDSLVIQVDDVKFSATSDYYKSQL